MQHQDRAPDSRLNILSYALTCSRIVQLSHPETHEDQLLVVSLGSASRGVVLEENEQRSCNGVDLLLEGGQRKGQEPFKTTQYCRVDLKVGIREGKKKTCQGKKAKNSTDYVHLYYFIVPD